MTNNDLIWYVSYGSNLDIDRFNCYIFGGTPQWSNRNHIGARIKKDPVKQQFITIPYELYFSKSGKSWQNKAVAFIKSTKNEGIKTICKSYLISKDQFIDVFLQENSKNPFQDEIKIDFDLIIKSEEFLAWRGAVHHDQAAGGRAATETRGDDTLLRGTEAPGAELKAQIPWLRVFVEGVVIVGKLKN